MQPVLSPRGCTASTILALFLGLGLLWGLAGVAEATDYCGVEFPQGEISFADEVVDFVVGSYALPPYIDPSKALGIPECTGPIETRAVSLGNYGVLVIGFTDNVLLASGTSAKDLWVYEVGSGTEEVDVDVSSDGSLWISVGRIDAGTQGIDLDAYYPSGIQIGVPYKYVRLRDVGNNYFEGPYAGADINAVGAISTMPSTSSDLEVTKTPMTESVTEGDTLSWTIAVHNHGPDNADLVSIRDPLPLGLTLVQAIPSQGECSYADHCVSCALGAMPSGADADVHVLVRFDSAWLLNTCSVSSGSNDPNPANNADSAAVHINCANSGLTGPGRGSAKRLSLVVTPNPVASSSLIAFTLPAASPVRLVVYDVAGRRVRELVNGPMEAGPHAVPWDGRAEAGIALSRGVYFVTIESSGARIAKQAVLIR